MAFDLETLVRPNIRKLEPYRCARDDFKEGVLLDANENTHGPALATISLWEAQLELNRYPDPHQIDLKEQICAFRNQTVSSLKKSSANLTPANLCLGVGSDESIDLLIRCVCTPGKDKLMVCPPTYGMYLICATVNDVQLAPVPLTVPDFQIDTEAVVKAATSDSSIKMMYLTSPGNPTAKLLDTGKIVELLQILKEKWNGLVVVDEAYIDFAGPGTSCSTLVTEWPNLVVMQTLSKSFGLAGVRLGITFSSEQLARYLNAMKYPYNISSLTSAVALRSMSPVEGLEVMRKYVLQIHKQRGIVVEELQKLDGIGKNIGGLDANFILLQILDKSGSPSNDVARELYHRLATEKGVVVRFRGTELNCSGALRISIGTDEENKVLVQRMGTLLEEIRSSA